MKACINIHLLKITKIIKYSKNKLTNESTKRKQFGLNVYSM